MKMTERWRKMAATLNSEADWVASETGAGTEELLAAEAATELLRAAEVVEEMERLVLAAREESMFVMGTSGVRRYLDAALARLNEEDREDG